MPFVELLVKAHNDATADARAFAMISRFARSAEQPMAFLVAYFLCIVHPSRSQNAEGLRAAFFRGGDDAQADIIHILLVAGGPIEIRSTIATFPGKLLLVAFPVERIRGSLRIRRGAQGRGQEVRRRQCSMEAGDQFGFSVSYAAGLRREWQVLFAAF